MNQVKNLNESKSMTMLGEGFGLSEYEKMCSWSWKTTLRGIRISLEYK